MNSESEMNSEPEFEVCLACGMEYEVSEGCLCGTGEDEDDYSYDGHVPSAEYL